jgi:hypothetical protein
MPEETIVVKKKRVNSKRKGAGNEGTLCKILAKELAPFKFIRSQASGAMVGGKNFAAKSHLYSQEALHFFVSDIVCSNESEVSKKFRFVIEAKAYKESDKLEQLLNGKSKIYSWIEQVKNDAVKVNKDWIVIYKFNATPFYCAVSPLIELPVDTILTLPSGDKICYLNDLLKFPTFWEFNE